MLVDREHIIAAYSQQYWLMIRLADCYYTNVLGDG